MRTIGRHSLARKAGFLPAGELWLVGGVEEFAGPLWSASWAHVSDAP